VAGALVASLLATALIVGLATGWLAGLVRKGGSATGLASQDTSVTASASAPAESSVPSPSGSTARSDSSVPTVGLPSPILPADESNPPPRAARVAAAVAGPSRSAVPDFGGSVVDVVSGKALYARRATRQYIPASTTKLLTGAAALAALGPDHRFLTRVVRPRPGQLTLVGGGDPYLERRHHPQRASLADLAAATARRLAAAGEGTVSLRYDATLFTGPSFAPSWPAAYGDQVAPVSALWVDQARAGGRRVKDSPRAAARAFAAALQREGVRVKEVKAGRAPRTAEPVATVRSLPLHQIVEALVRVSDNDAAEVVFRHTALASGEPGSFTGGRRAVTAQLRALGVWERGAEIHDGSGLSRDNRLPPVMLTALLRLAAGDQHLELRLLLSGLPVAGVEGSLQARFADETSRPGRGLVRAKTGTLRDVHALAGYVRSVDGSVLVYAFLVARPRNAYRAQVWLDQVTAALSQCGCR